MIDAMDVDNLPVGTGREVLVSPLAVRHMQPVEVAVLEAQVAASVSRAPNGYLPIASSSSSKAIAVSRPEDSSTVLMPFPEGALPSAHVR